MSKTKEIIFEYGNSALSIDEHYNLYWNDKKIVTEQKIKLQSWVSVSIIVASISTLAIAVISALQFFGYGP